MKLESVNAKLTLIATILGLIATVYAASLWVRGRFFQPTPAEARETLQKRGAEMDLGGLGDAIRESDAESLKLFLISGINPDAMELRDALKDDHLAPVVVQYMKADRRNSACPTDDTAVGFYESFSDEGFQTLKKVCGNPTVIGKLKETATRYEQAAAEQSGTQNGQRLASQAAAFRKTISRLQS